MQQFGVYRKKSSLLKEEKQYLAHMRETLEYQLESQDMHMTLLRSSRSSPTPSSPAQETKTGEVDLTVSLDNDSVARGSTAADWIGKDTSTIVAGLSNQRAEREFHRIRTELRKERLTTGKLQGQLTKSEEEGKTLQGLNIAKDEEIRGLRQDIVTLVSKVQYAEQALLKRTGMYEAAIAQVEKLSLKATKERRSRKDMQEFIRGIDLQLSVGQISRDAPSPLRPSRKLMSKKRSHGGSRGRVATGNFSNGASSDSASEEDDDI